MIEGGYITCKVPRCDDTATVVVESTKAARVNYLTVYDGYNGSYAHERFYATAAAYVDCALVDMSMRFANVHIKVTLPVSFCTTDNNDERGLGKELFRGTCEYVLLNGMQHGVFQVHTDRRRLFKCHFERGLLQGTSRSWYQDDTLASDAMYHIVAEGAQNVIGKGDTYKRDGARRGDFTDTRSTDPTNICAPCFE
jgi:hypothetical protein